MPLFVTVGDPERELVADGVGVDETVPELLAVREGVPDAVGVPDSDAPVDGLRVPVPLILGEPDGLRLPVAVPVSVPLLLGVFEVVTVPDAVCVGEAPLERDAVCEAVADGVPEREGVSDGVPEPLPELLDVPVGDGVRLREGVPVSEEDCEDPAEAVRVAVPEPLGVPETLAVGELLGVGLGVSVPVLEVPARKRGAHESKRRIGSRIAEHAPPRKGARGGVKEPAARNSSCNRRRISLQVLFCV